MTLRVECEEHCPAECPAEPRPAPPPLPGPPPAGRPHPPEALSAGQCGFTEMKSGTQKKNESRPVPTGRSPIGPPRRGWRHES